MKVHFPDPPSTARSSIDRPVFLLLAGACQSGTTWAGLRPISFIQVYFPDVQYDEGNEGCENYSHLLGSRAAKAVTVGTPEGIVTGDAAATEANCDRGSASETIGDGGSGDALDELCAEPELHDHRNGGGYERRP